MAQGGYCGATRGRGVPAELPQAESGRIRRGEEWQVVGSQWWPHLRGGLHLSVV